MARGAASGVDGAIPRPLTRSTWTRPRQNNSLPISSPAWTTQLVRWDRYGLAVPVAVPCIRRDISGSPTEPEPIYCFARAGDEVLIHDDVEEEFGTGILDNDGVLRQWGTYGEELRWSLHHFPQSSTSEATAPA